MWTVGEAQLVADNCADCDLQALDLIHHENAQLAVELIEIDNLLERRSGVELPRGTRCLGRHEIQEVPLEPKIAYEPQRPLCFGYIRDRKSYRL